MTERLPFGYELALSSPSLSDEAKETLHEFLFTEVAIALTGVELTVILDLIQKRTTDAWTSTRNREDFVDLYNQIKIQSREELKKVDGIDGLVREARDVRLGLDDASVEEFFEEYYDPDTDGYKYDDEPPF